MKKILRYGKHLLAAKGRHGTHSPFVYAFVEEVLRNKKRFYYKGKTGSFFSVKEENLLLRIIRYLEPSLILTEQELMPLLHDMLAATGHVFPKMDTFDATHITWQEGSALLIFNNHDDRTLELLRTYIEQHTVYVLQVRPHSGVAAENSWNTLSAMGAVRMRLDLWFFGLLVNDPAFKASQYFRLR